METLSLQQEPFKPASIKVQLLLKGPSLVNLLIPGKLGALNQS